MARGDMGGVRFAPPDRTLLVRECVRSIDRAPKQSCRRGATEDAMKKLLSMAGVAMLAAFAALPALAQQDAAKKTPPKPAPSPSAAVLESWNDIGRKLIAMAEDIPEDKYGYKPHADSRTFVANFLHPSTSIY